MTILRLESQISPFRKPRINPDLVAAQHAQAVTPPPSSSTPTPNSTSNSSNPYNLNVVPGEEDEEDDVEEGAAGPDGDGEREADGDEEATPPPSAMYHPGRRPWTIVRVFMIRIVLLRLAR